MKEIKYGITKEGIVRVEIEQSFLPNNPLLKDWLYWHLAFHKAGWDIPCPDPWEELEALGEKEDIKGLKNMPIDDILFALTTRGYAIQPVYLREYAIQPVHLYEHSGIAMSVSPFLISLQFCHK